MKKKFFIFILIALMLVIVAGCTPGTGLQGSTPALNSQTKLSGVSIQLYAPGPNPAVNTADAHDRIAGFLVGIWHGIISPVTLVMSFLNDGVQMYEVHNIGNLYNLGFLLGVAIVFILLGALVGSRRR
jgi:hypothetical protein